MLNSITYPRYIQTIKDSKIDMYFDASQMDDKALNDAVFDWLVEQINQWHEKNNRTRFPSSPPGRSGRSGQSSPPSPPSPSRRLNMPKIHTRKQKHYYGNRDAYDWYYHTRSRYDFDDHGDPNTDPPTSTQSSSPINLSESSSTRTSDSHAMFIYTARR